MIIQHSRGEYPVEFLSIQQGHGRLRSGDFVVTDENVHRAYGNHVQVPAFVVPAGEKSKSFKQLEAIAEWLALSGATRKSRVVALGGGVVGDLAGFVAAAYQRGVEFLQIPTSLLAQVDSSVGGKVAIDLVAGKNLFGAFHPPVAVYLPIDALDTLDPREFRAGAAEIWKTGAILDVHLLERLEQAPLSLKSDDLPDVISRCIELKAGVVQEDEFETTGRRAILNFGHTVAHAIEQVTGYGPILHGEAVSIGMVVEARLGEQLEVTPRGFSERLRAGLVSQRLPVDLPGVSRTALVEAMRRDKKVTTGGLAFALVIEPGGCKLVTEVAESEILAAMSGN